MYVFGHKNPDTDSIVAAIAYAELKRQFGENWKPVRIGSINSETELVLKRFGVDVPEEISSVKGSKVILVDHNEFEQSADDIKEAEIIEVIDHHKMKFSWDKPIYILTKPVGSTSTIIAEKYIEQGVEITEEIAGLLLSGILSDTVIFKSPTTTEEDKNIAKKLAEISGVSMNEWGIEMFRAKSKISEKTANEIITGDSKVYEFSGKRVLIGQVEVIGDSEVLQRKDELFEEMKRIKEEKELFGVMFLITDIMKGGSTVLVIADELTPFKKAFGVSFENGEAYLEGVMSRKKQVVPPLENVF